MSAGKRCGGSGQEPDWSALGAAVRAAREERGWGVRELARRAGCSPAYVTDVEYGRRGGGLSGDKTRALLAAVGMQSDSTRTAGGKDAR